MDINQLLLYEDGFVGEYDEKSFPVYSPYAFSNGLKFVIKHRYYVGVIMEDDKCYYFDPLGKKPTIKMQKRIEEYVDKTIYNNKKFESYQNEITALFIKNGPFDKKELIKLKKPSYVISEFTKNFIDISDS